MLLVLSIAAAVLLAACALLYAERRDRRRKLAYLAEQLQRITDEKSAERLMLVTDDRELRRLLVSVNALLDHKTAASAQFAGTEQSMKRLLANISHDMKTPLTVVLGYLEMMMHNPGLTDAERARILRNTHAKTVDIVELMNSFFDLAKLEAGDSHISLSKLQMNELCRQTILTFFDTMQEKGLEADIQIPEEPIYSHANAEAVERVLFNLLSNALRYGSDGGVIGLSLFGDERHVYVQVWDRGAGIDMRDQERVFERLFTLDESRSKSFQGSGLGLTITKRLVEGMGGSIALASEPYRKTVFTVKLNRLSY